MMESYQQTSAERNQALRRESQTETNKQTPVLTSPCDDKIISTRERHRYLVMAVLANFRLVKSFKYIGGIRTRGGK